MQLDLGQQAQRQAKIHRFGTVDQHPPTGLFRGCPVEIAKQGEKLGVVLLQGLTHPGISPIGICSRRLTKGGHACAQLLQGIRPMAGCKGRNHRRPIGAIWHRTATATGRLVLMGLGQIADLANILHLIMLRQH